MTWEVLFHEQSDPEFDALPDEVQDKTLKTLEQKMKGLPATRHEKIEKRAATLIAEEMTLQELRRARKITQVRIAKALGIHQAGVSRLEKRSDLLFSTLRKAVAAMGGNLSLVASFPDREPVVLSGIIEVEAEPTATRRRRVRKR